MITDEQTQELLKKQVFQWVAVKAVVIEDRKILLGKRKDNDSHGLFELPGGKLELGEDFVTALKREVLEETGIEVEPVNVESKVCYPVIVTSYCEKIVFLILQAQVVSKQNMMKETEEQSEIKFYSRDEVKKILEDKAFIPAYNELAKMFINGEMET